MRRLGVSSGGASPPEPIYGDGSDGEQIFASNGNLGGIVKATTFEVQSGASLNVNSSVLFVHATESITVAGEIDGTGATFNGGRGGNRAFENGNGSDGDPGGDGLFAGGGGVGGDAGDDTNTGGDGQPGGGRIRNPNGLRTLLGPAYADIYDEIAGAGAGGGGGGGGAAATRDGVSGDNEGGAGGDGGDGGAIIVLLAPTVTVTGQIISAGTDGQDGDDGVEEDIFEPSDHGGGGGGGGGSGGAAVLAGATVEDNGTYDFSGGLGGAAGEGQPQANPGADGSDGPGVFVVPVP